jgi:hypothetical protein
MTRQDDHWTARAILTYLTERGRSMGTARA